MGEHRYSGMTVPAAKMTGERRLPWDFLLGSAAALILISVARLHAFFPLLAAIRPALITTAVAVVALLGSQQGARRVQHLGTPLGRWMAAFVVWAVITAPFGIYIGRSVSYLLDQFLREAVVILVVAASVRNVLDLERLLRVYGFGVIAFSVLAAGTGSRHVGGGGYDANDSAMFIVSGMPIIFYFLVRARKGLGKAFFGVGLAAAGSAIVLSGSRGGFLAFVAVLGYSLFFLKGIKKSFRLAVVALSVGVIAFSATGDFWARMQTIGDENDYNYTSYTGRKQVWTRGVGYMMDRPLYGVGIDNFSVAEGRHPDAQAMLARGKGVKFSTAHSIWVQTGAELGIPGVLILLGVFAMSGKALATIGAASRPAGRSSLAPELEPLAELGRPLIGVLVGAFVAGTFLSRAYSSLLWLPFGLTLAVEKLARIKEKELRRAAARKRQPTAAR